MHPANLDWIARKVTTMVVKTLAFEDDTALLKSMTNRHRDEWVKAMRQVVEKIEEGIKVAEETDYDL